MNSKKSTDGSYLLPPDTILQSRYRIVRQLGKGGMGAVYEAIDNRLGHTVALKQTLTQEEELWKQFEREARLMAGLDHPVLPRVSDYFIEGNRAFFVMQFVAGPDLAEVISQGPGPLPRQVVVGWADQLLDALVYLHSHDRQIIHRDIKPHNLKVTALGQVALLDFGLAKSGNTTGEDNESASIFGYSPRYAPLEQIQARGTTPQSDIYALGATLYHLLTGVKPPDALTRATALISSQPNPLKPAHEINRAIGPELSAILARAMEQNPNERYGSAKEFREAIRRVGRVGEAVVQPWFRDAQIDARAGAIDETVIASTSPFFSTSRLGERAPAALLVILLAAFAVFCRYYPWKIPAEVNVPVSADSRPDQTVVQDERPTRDQNRARLNGSTRAQPASSDRTVKRGRRS